MAASAVPSLAFQLRGAGRRPPSGLCPRRREILNFTFITMFKSILTAFFLFLSLLAIGQKQIPEPTDFLVNDYAHLMSQQEVDQLGRKLRDYALESSTQIVVVTEPSLEGEDPFEYSHRLAVAWGIGGGQYDNGILIYVAQQEREIRIQTGLGTEGFLPDALAKRIIDNIISPAFRQGNYYRGLDRATSAIMDLGRGEYTGEGQQPQPRDAKGGVPAILVIALIIFLIIVFSRMGKDDDDDDDGGYYRGGRYDRLPRRRRRGGGWIFLPGPWIGGGGGSGGGGGGGGFGGFGGGGFGGFGGGDFGGGGAGGSW